MPGTLVVTGMSAGLASGQKTIGPVTMTGLSTVGEIIDTALSSGDNTISLPPSADNETISAVLIILGTTTATVKVRTNLDSGDAGVQIAPYVGAGVPWCVLPLPSGVTSVILNASGTVTGVELSFI